MCFNRFWRVLSRKSCIIFRIWFQPRESHTLFQQSENLNLPLIQRHFQWSLTNSSCPFFYDLARKIFSKKIIKKNKKKTEIFSFLHKKSKRSGKSLKTSLSNRFAINLHYHSPAARLNGWCRNIMAMLSFLMLVCPVQGYRGCDWSRSVVIFLWPWDRRFAFLGRGFRW